MSDMHETGSGITGDGGLRCSNETLKHRITPTAMIVFEAAKETGSEVAFQVISEWKKCSWESGCIV